MEKTLALGWRWRNWRLIFFLACTACVHFAACAISGTGAGISPNLIQCPTSICAPAAAVTANGDVGQKNSTSKGSPVLVSGSGPESDFRLHPNFHLLPTLDDCGYQYKFPETATTTPKSISDSSTRPSWRFKRDGDAHGSRSRRRRTKRVIGGMPAEIGTHPWMVQLMFRNVTTNSYRVICGGSIINNYTILTAAHCVTSVGADAALTVVVLGSYRNQDLANTGLGGLGLSLSSVHMRNCDLDEDGELVCWVVHLAKIKDIIIHEDFLVGEGQDVALVKLRDSIYRFNASVKSLSTNATVRELLGTFERPGHKLENGIKSEASRDFVNHPNFKLLPSKDVCGLVKKGQGRQEWSNRFVRSIGGRLVYPGDLPGLANIFTTYPSGLGSIMLAGIGVLINSKYVLVTANLLRSFHKTELLHSVGLKTNLESDREYLFSIESVIVHEKYRVGTFTNDLALLRLANEVSFTDTVVPVCLPVNETFSPRLGTNAASACISGNLVSAGWGLTTTGDSSSPLLPSLIEMKLRPREHCDRVYARKIGKLDASKFCASSCLGESTGLCGDLDLGAALLQGQEVPAIPAAAVPARNSDFGADFDGENSTDRKQYTLVGLASYFLGCAHQGMPDMFTNISYHLPWILDNIRP